MSYGIDEIFSNVTFSINKGERIAIVGPNGAGKSTLMDILAGDVPPESGSFFMAPGLKPGYFRQNDMFRSENTVYEEMSAIFSDIIELEEELKRVSSRIAELSEGSGKASGNEREAALAMAEYERISAQYESLNGYSYRSEINGILNSMSFPPSCYDKKISSLSGGERTRLALAALLLKKPDILLLDEPTNHLDLETLKWLEQYLRSYSGTVILISHDRYFLDRTADRTFELDNHRLTVYEGNYTFYAAEKKVRYINELKAYEKQQAEVKRQEDMIRRYKERGTEKLAKRARSREKHLERMEILDKPNAPRSQMKIRFIENTRSGNDTLQAHLVSKSVGVGESRRSLFEDVEFDIKRGERVCVIGANGVGKSTLLKIIMSEIRPDSGYIKVGHNVSFGYYDQEQSVLNENSNVIEEMRDSYSLYDDGELRGLLGRFLFKGDDVFKPVSGLSGGERARLSLLKLMLSGANVLLLDEPTNHLDIDSKEVLEDAIIDYPGTSIIISHDRYLLNKVPTSIFEIEGGRLTVYKGNYDFYTEKKTRAADIEDAGSGSGARAASKSPEGSSREERRRSKEQQAEERKIKRRAEELESLISALESEIGDLEAEMCREDIVTDHNKLTELSEALSEKKEALDDAYSQWLEIQQ